MLFVLWTLLQAAQSEPAPVPDPAAQKMIEKTLRDIFKAEYQKRAPADRLALAEKLQEQAQGSKDDPPTQYVLWSEARDLYLEGGDLASALKMVTHLEHRFAIDPIAMKSAALSSAGRTAKMPEELSMLTKSYLRLADDAIELDDGEGVARSIEQAITLAKRSKDLALISRAQARSKEAADWKAKFERIRKARETLAKFPQDPAASAVIGRYDCLSKGRWEAGLPMLARGTDPASALAASDLAGPSEPNDELALADGWWGLGDSETPSVRLNLHARAACWYEKCVLKLSGLSRAKAENRLRQERIEMLSRGEWVDETDPGLFGLKGKTGDPIVLPASAGHGLNVEFDSFPKGDFDGLMVRAHVPRGVCAVVEFEREMYGCWIDGRLQEVHVSRAVPPNGWNPYVAAKVDSIDDFLISVLITDGSYVVCFDGKEVFRLPTKQTQIFSLLFHTMEGTSTFDQLRLRRRR